MPEPIDWQAPPDVGGLIGEHMRLVGQLADVERAIHDQAVVVTIDGVEHWVLEADELTRAAIFEVETRLDEAHAAWS